MMDVQTTELTNGVRIGTDRYPGVASVSISAKVLSGTRQDPTGREGLAHFLEHMAFKGTTNRSAEEITAAIEDRGGYLNAATSKESTAYAVQVLAEDQGIALDVLSDMIINSTLPGVEIENERDVILQEIADDRDSVRSWSFDKFMEIAFHRGVGLPGLGSEESVRTIDRADLQTYMATHYRADNLLICASGALDHDDFACAVEDRFGDMLRFAGNGHAPSLYTGGTNISQSDNQQAHVYIGFPGLPRDHADIYAQGLLGTILGGTSTSRLFLELRERRGLCYEIDATNASFSDAGVFYVNFACAPESLSEALDVTTDELLRLRDGLSDIEIARGKKLMSASLLMGLESTRQRSAFVDHNLTVYNRAFSMERELELNEEVDAAAIKRVVEHMATASPTFFVVCPEPTGREADVMSKFTWPHR